MKKIIYLAIMILICSFVSSKSFAYPKTGHGQYVDFVPSQANPNHFCERMTWYTYTYESTTGAILSFTSTTTIDCGSIVVHRDAGGAFDPTGHCINLYFTSCSSEDDQDPSYQCNSMDTPEYISGLIANINYNVDNPQ